MKPKNYFKYSLYILPVIMFLSIALAFLVKNNITADYSTSIGLVDTEHFTQEEVKQFVQDEMLRAFTKLRKQQLGTEISPCFKHNIIFHYDYPEEANIPFNKGQLISAQVKEEDCEQGEHLFSLKINYEKKILQVRMNIVQDWTNANQFLKEYQKQI